MFAAPTRIGRFVFIAQWFAVIIIPIYLVFGRALVGSPLGWGVLVGVIASPAIVIDLVIAPIISVATDSAHGRRRRSPSRSY